MRYTVVLASGFALLALIGCTPEEQAAAPAAEPMGSPAVMSEAVTTMPAQSTPSFTGRVAETMDSAGYTYALLQTEMGEIWVAGPETALQVGEVVTGSNGMAMGDFHSKSLNRDFDSIYFVSRFLREGEELAEAEMAMPADHASMEMPSGMGMPGAMTASAPALGAPPANVTRIGDLFSTSAGLAGKTVSVQGEVVKFNQAIMGVNWVHLRDGSGDEAAATHDLTLTTDDVVAVGDKVKMAGVVTLNKDFGAGYSYDLILESARVIKE